MATILAHKTVSMTDLREPAKVLKMAENSPVALLNRNTVVGYFVPAGAVENVRIREASDEEVDAALAAIREDIDPVLEYLKDK
ncbi:MAG: prevent-host-death family protein [Gammaproteobacteria bacterium]|nr:prevent-host-death family protein [Gammaproteobacteria bacterium]